ncbi:MAG TPA: DUF4386 domain-containing protein [Acidimicrobiales bacterium]|nr:DUF4386 domain-containing protein [Acidimicrobiales bacterium]
MATDDPTTLTTDPSDRTRRLAFAAGALYIVTFVTSIPVLGMYDQALSNADFVLGAGSDVPVRLGGLLEVICGLAGIATAVVLYPVTRRVSRTAAVGFVGSRVVEASMIFVGVLSVLSIVTLRQDAAGADPASLTTAWHSLVAIKDWTFLLGPGYMPAVNALCLATVMYKARLVPRLIPTVGLVGAPLLVISSTVTLFGGWEQVSTPAMAFGLPIAAWEFTLGMWMMLKGFSHSPAAATAPEPTPALAVA